MPARCRCTNLARTRRLPRVGATLCLLWVVAGPTGGHATGPPRPSDDATATHALNRMAFGPRPDDVARVRSEGLAAWIDRQLHPDRIDDRALEARLSSLTTLGMSTKELSDRYFEPALRERRARQQAQAPEGMPGTRAAFGEPATTSPDASRREPPSEAMRGAQRVLEELTEQRILRAVYSERQLNEVLVDFWFNHFNVFAGKGAVRVYLTEYERDVVRPRVLGRFRDLLGAVARSPAMLFYLDNWMSVDPDAVRRLESRRSRAGLIGGRRGFADAPRRGAAAPGASGQNAVAAGRGLNENYARELLELHTLGVDGGYTQQDVVEVARAFTGWTIDRPRDGGSFVFRAQVHDNDPKTVLGRRIDAGGVRDGEAVLDLLARHPSTATHLATKLARRFVADDPPASLVQRAAATFRSTDGDLREVVRVIVTSPEFLDAAARRAKVKSPFEFVTSALRVTGAEIADARALARGLRTLGMPLYLSQPPTGYADSGEAWATSGALLGRMNFAIALVGNGVPGVTVRVPDGADVSEARRRVVGAVLGESVSDATRDTIGRAQALPQVVALALGSPEFQRR